MRPMLSRAVQATLAGEHAKDLTKLPRAELFARRDEVRPPGG